MLYAALQALGQTRHKSPHVAPITTNTVDLDTACLLAAHRDILSVIAKTHTANSIETCPHVFNILYTSTIIR